MIVLRDDGVHLLDLSDPLSPRISASLAGSFGDLATGPDFIVLSQTGGFAIYSLPEFAPLATFPAPQEGTIRLACASGILTATFGRMLCIFDVAEPADPRKLGRLEIPHYNEYIGVGELVTAGDYVVGASYHGNGIIGYHTAISVFDVTDPRAPAMTDYVTELPGHDPGAIILFMDLAVGAGGLVVAGLVDTSPYRPEYIGTDHFLAQFAIDADGALQWRGVAYDYAAMPCGVVVDGDKALWLLANGNRVVEFDEGGGEPVVRYCEHSFPVGHRDWPHEQAQAVWLKEQAVLRVGSHLFHLTDIRPTEAPPYSYWNDNRLELLDEKVALSLRWWSDDYSASWNLVTVDYSRTPPVTIQSTGSSWNIVDELFVFDRRVYYRLNGMQYIDVADDGSFAGPFTSTDVPFYSVVPWDDYFVISHTDMSIGVYEQDSLRNLISRARISPRFDAGRKLVRVGDYLLCISDYYHSADVFDLTDPLDPTYLTNTSAVGANARYVLEHDLVIDFDGNELRWYRLGASHRLTLIGQWEHAPDVFIRDLHLSGDLLHLAFGPMGLNLYRFDENTGLEPLGGDMTYRVRQMQQGPDGRLVVSPHLRTVPGDCDDSVPLFVTDFAAVRDGDLVRLTWRCRDAAGADSEFLVVRRTADGLTPVAAIPARVGEHATEDRPPHGGWGCHYDLCHVRANGERVILDSASLSPPTETWERDRVAAFPNPANPGTTVRFDHPAGGWVRVSIYAVDGRHVVDLADGQLAAGVIERKWDGRDARGRSVASGTYLVRVETRTRITSGRISLIR